MSLAPIIRYTLHSLSVKTSFTTIIKDIAALKQQKGGEERTISALACHKKENTIHCTTQTNLPHNISDHASSKSIHHLVTWRTENSWAVHFSHLSVVTVYKQTSIHSPDNIISDVICTTLWRIPHTRRLINRAAGLKNILFWLNCIFYCGTWPLQGQIASECWLHHYLWIIDLREWNYGLISSRKWGRVSRWEPALCYVWTFLASLCGLYTRAVVPYDWSGTVGLAKPFCRTIWKEHKSQWLFLRINCLLCNGNHCQQKNS